MTNLASPGYVKNIYKGKFSNILLLSDNSVLLVNFEFLLLLVVWSPVYGSSTVWYP